jgi:pyrroline-5-carboxylate reductase
VTIASDNQAVLDTCDIVCLGVTPQMAESVLSELKFKEGHTIISFLSVRPRLHTPLILLFVLFSIL